MTQEEKTSPPGMDPEDLKVLIGYLETMKEDILLKVQGISNRVALLQRDTLTMKDSVTAMAADFSEARISRLEEEINQVEKEKEILLSRVAILDEQSRMKKNDTTKALSTNEKIRITAKETTEQTIEDRVRLERAEREERIKKRQETITTAVMVSLAVGGVGSAISFIWWLILQYANR